MYCNNCGYKIDDSDKFCKKCGNAINRPEQENQPPQVYHTPVQQTSGYHAPMSTDRDVWGRFGGLIVYGALIILILIIGAASSTIFLDSINLGNIGRQIVMLLPIGFAIGLTVKHKGVDLSFPAMAALTSVICCMTQTLALGILLSLMACIVIGAINAVCIHFLKLPGMLVTITIYLIVSFVSRSLVISGMMVKLDVAPGLIFVVALIAAIVAVGIALLSSICKDSRNKFWSTLVVYAGSGVLAVLYMIALSIRCSAMISYNTSWMMATILLIATFLSITRFFKSKALGIVFAIIPTIFAALVSNVFNIASVGPFYQQFVLLGIVLILLFVLFYRGRSQLMGQNLDKQYKAKSWIAFIPLLLLLLKNVIIGVVFLINISLPSTHYNSITSVYDVVLLLVTVGVCIVHALMKPKGSNIV